MTEKCIPSTLAFAVLALFVLAGFRLAMAAEAGAPAGPEVTVMTVKPQSARLSLDIVGEV